MTTFIAKFIAMVIGPKQGWREYKARARRLPENYRAALDALERYLNYLGPGVPILADLLDLFEQSAAIGTPLHEVVGEDPVAFIEAFVDNYPEGHWRAQERERFVKAIKHIEREQENR